MKNIIDISQSLDQAGGNEELAKELLTMLLKELPLLNEKLHLAIQSRDTAAMWDHAHKLYGSTAYCGVPDLRLAAKSLEEAVKRDEYDLILTCHTQVCDTIAILLTHAETWLGRPWH